MLWDPMELVLKGMMLLAAIELLFKMQEQSRYFEITLKLKRHYFKIQKEVDTGMCDTMQRMYQLDFIEPRTNFKDLVSNRLDEISYEDKFLKIMEDQVVKVGKPYETPLPLRNPEIALPSKKVIPEKRVHYLKRKFQKDEQYFSHYKHFMNEITKKRYARVSDRTPVDGKFVFFNNIIDYNWTRQKVDEKYITKR